MSRMRELERSMVRSERKERKRNVIIKDIEVKEGKEREAIANLLKGIRPEVEVEKVSKIDVKERENKMWVVKLTSEEQRREVMKKKSNLRGRKGRIWEDWTVSKRKMRWKVEWIAREEERQGRRVDRGYGKLRVYGGFGMRRRKC